MAIEVRTKVARNRAAEGARQINSIRGDLDWIVMKALEKDRTRHCATAARVWLFREINRRKGGE
jgi:hypothetical protein